MRHDGNGLGARRYTCIMSLVITVGKSVWSIQMQEKRIRIRKEARGSVPRVEGRFLEHFLFVKRRGKTTVVPCATKGREWDR